MRVKQEELSDYSGFDFRSTWVGRDDVTDLERSIVRKALSARPGGRVLEVGVGFGRLTEVVQEVAPAYVGVDLDAGQLSSVAGRSESATSAPVPSLFVEANAYHLPFVDSAFSEIVLIRVFHHVGEPSSLLRELRRCLAEGGRLLLQYNPRPTIGTLVMDVEQNLRPAGGPRTPVTWSRAETVEIRGGRFPIFVRRSRDVQRSVTDAGFVIEREWGTGAEHLQRWLPRIWKRAIDPKGPIGLLLPARFLLARNPGNAPLELPDRFLACPRCRTPLGAGGPEATVPCSACGFVVRFVRGVLRARFSPTGEATE